MATRWAGLLVGMTSLVAACGTQSGRQEAYLPPPTSGRTVDLTIDVAPAAVGASLPATFPPIVAAAISPTAAPAAPVRALAAKPVTIPLPAEDVAGPSGSGQGTDGGSAGSSTGTSTGSSAEPIGFLDAPSVGIATFIVENGWSKRQLDRGGAGSGGAPIASEGNIVLFGHRTSHGGVFRHIDDLEIGAELDVTVPNGPTRKYTVVEKFLDLPDAVQWADETNTINGHSTITLISCAHADGSPGGTDRRWFVRAAAA